MGWEIATKPGLDDKVKLQALALISECEKNIMDLVTNGVYVTNAYNSVQAKLDQLNKSEKALLQDIKQKEGKTEQQQEEDIESQKTTNGIF